MFTTLNSYKASLLRRLAAIRDWNIVLPQIVHLLPEHSAVCSPVILCDIMQHKCKIMTSLSGETEQRDLQAFCIEDLERVYDLYAAAKTVPERSVFVWSEALLPRNASDDDIIAAFEKHADDTSLIAQYAPDEFAASVQRWRNPFLREVSYALYKMPAVIGGTHSPQDKICGNKFVDNHIFCIFVHKQTQYGIY
mgnify:CR=1 FL=1